MSSKKVKFAERVQLHKCLYSVDEDFTAEQIEESWRQVSRATKQGVSYCKKLWKKQLKRYANYLEQIKDNPNATFRDNMEDMAFVRANLPQLLKRARRPSGEGTEPAVSLTGATVCENSAASTIDTIKEEPSRSAPEDVQEMPTASPLKRMRRNAIDGVVSLSNTFPDTENQPQTSCEHAAAPYSQQHRNIPMTTACEDRLTNPPVSVPQPREGCSMNAFWNMATEPNLAFGLFVSTTLNKLPARKQIFAKESIYQVLKNAEISSL